MVLAASVDRWEYRGDVNLEYGGTWFNLDDVEYGYVEAVEVVDLDSGAGARGMVLVRKITIITDNPDVNRKAIESCGWLDGATPSPIELAEAVMLYGFFDTESDYVNGPSEEVIQLDPDEDMTCEGWTATKRMDPDELLAYIESDYLT